MATVVTALVMVGVYRFFAAGLASWNRGQADLGPVQDARAFMDNVQAELESLELPLPADQASLLAWPDTLTFYTTCGLTDRSIAAARGGTRVTYQFVRPRDGGATGGSVRRTRQFHSGSQPIGPEAAATVLDGVRDITFEYLAPPAPAQGRNAAEWVKLWMSPGDPPAAVRITLTLVAPTGLGQHTRIERLAALVPIVVRPGPTDISPP